MVGDRRLRIVYFGTPEFAVPTLQRLLASTHPVVALVSQPDRPKGRGQRLVETPTKAVAIASGVPVLQPTRLRDEAFLAHLAGQDVDLGVVAAYGRIIPDELLRLPRLGLINVHASLLPKYRGAAPIHRAVIAGEVETGVTIMRVVQALDAGPMFASVRRPIGPDDTSVDVERDLATHGADLLVEVVGEIARGTATETPQDETLATYAFKITRAEGTVDWSLPARDIHNLVRGLQPWPLVSVTVGGTRCSIHRTAVTGDQTSMPPARIVTAAGDALTVATGGGGLLRILTLQPEGRRAMSAREFLAGRPVQAGLRLSP